MQFGNRFGEERLDLIQKRIDFNVSAIDELVNKADNITPQISVDGLKSAIKDTQYYNDNRPENIRSVFDSIACFVALSLKHPEAHLKEEFWKQALEWDPIQAYCIRHYLRPLQSAEKKDFIERLRNELQLIAGQIGVDGYLDSLDAFQDSDWTEAQTEAYLIHNLAILGERNTDNDGIRKSKSISWRRHWLVGWVFRHLIEADRTRNEVCRFNALRNYNSIYALVFKAMVYPNPRYLKMAMADPEDEIVVCLIQYRFGDDVITAGERCYNILSRMLSTGKYAGIKDDVRQSIIADELCGREFNILPPVERPVPIAYVRAVIRNDVMTHYRNIPNKELIVDSETLNNFPESDEDNEADAQRLLDAVFEVATEIPSVRRRVAFILTFNTLPPQDWITELSNALNIDQDRAVHLCRQIIDSQTLEYRDQSLSELFGVDADSVHRYARRGRSDIERIIEARTNGENQC